MPRLVSDGALANTRLRRDAVAAIARPDDLVLMPARPGVPGLRRDSVAVASLPVGCSVGVPTRPRATAGLATATPVLVDGRAAG